MFATLVTVSLLGSVVPYVLLYFGRHNSLYDDAVYLSLLAGLVLLYRGSFKKFVLSRRNVLTGFAVAVCILLLLDLAVNTSPNLYKKKMYVLLCVMYFLCFLFTKLREEQKTRLVFYVLLTWMTVSFVELFLRLAHPELFSVFPWNGMTLQSALRRFVSAGYISPVESKVYGLGIGSQSNVIAVMSVLVFVFTGPLASMPGLFRTGLAKVLLICAAVVILPFTLSLTSIVALLGAIVVVALKRAARLTVAATLALSSVIAGVAWFFVFNIGDVVGFVANTESRAVYVHELAFWPLEFLRENPTRILLGLYNDITSAPLENRYFNVLLALGAPLTLYIAFSLFRMFRRLLRRSSLERNGTLRLMLFVLLCIAYVHISFAAHLPGLILLATLFVFVAEPLRLVSPASHPARLIGGVRQEATMDSA